MNRYLSYFKHHIRVWHEGELNLVPRSSVKGPQSENAYVISIPPGTKADALFAFFESCKNPQIEPQSFAA